MKPRVGTTLSSTVDATTVVVTRWGADDLDVRCGGQPMVEGRNGDGGESPGGASVTRLGKRYADEASGVELLCTRAGSHPLVVGGVELPEKAAKPLPASD